MWEIVLVDEVDEWFLGLAKSDPDSAELVQAAIDLLEREGPLLGRPAADRIKGSRVHNMKELRPASAGTNDRDPDPVRLRSRATSSPARRWRQIWTVEGVLRRQCAAC